MKGFVYILLSNKDQKSYVGSTTDFERRFAEHNDGLCESTKHRRPLTMIYKEEYKNILDARLREQYLKSRNGRRELKKIFEKIIK